jgi:uncharacterized repeat protein (TIGR01451 family)
MNPKRRLGGYLLALLVLFGLALFAPRAWATPGQARPGQGVSVPTLTPVREWSPSPPTDTPPTRPPDDAPATPLPPGTTPVMPGVSTTTPLPAKTTTVATGAAALALAKTVDRLQTWPGAMVQFTLTASNAGSASARQLVLVDTLPAGLDPVPVQDASVAWDGRTLRGRLPLLPPGGQWVVTFSAIVREDAPAGALVVNSAKVAAAGGLSARAEAYLALPPVELPRVGGMAGGIPLP